MANRETHILNPAWPGLVGLCGRRVADDELVCASAPESGPLSYRRETPRPSLTSCAGAFPLGDVLAVRHRGPAPVPTSTGRSGTARRSG